MSPSEKKGKKPSASTNSFAPKCRKKKKTRQGNGKFSKPKAGKKVYRGQGR